jgi:ribonuclease PH
MNVVMTGAGLLVEAQATAEGAPFSRAELDRMIDLAAAGIQELTASQTRATLSVRPPVARALP